MHPLIFIVKRTGFLFEKIVDMDNLRLAFQKTCRGKAGYHIVQRMKKNPDKYLLRIQKMLIENTYRPSRYKTKIIHEPKERLIYILPLFPDRIIQHAVVNILGPFWDARFTPRSFSCRENKGTHPGSLLTSQYVRKYKYCLKMDIRKFYPSLNHHIMKSIFRRKIKDKKVLHLLDMIVDSIDGETNIPIGNLTSQWFGNLYMDTFDFYIENILGCKAYIRYCDDFCLFSNDKKELGRWRSDIVNFLREKLRLTLSKNDLFQTKQGVDFLGYRHFRKYILLRKSTAKRLQKRLRFFKAQLAKDQKRCILSMVRLRSSLASAMGYLKWANSWNFQKKTGIKEFFEWVKTESSVSKT